MKTKIAIIVTTLILVAFQLHSQVVVSNSGMFGLDEGKKTSPVALQMKKGQTKNFNLFTFKDNTYFITLNSPKKLGDLNYRVLNSNNEIIFDNALANYTNSIVIYAEKSEKITLQITSQPPKFLQSNKKSFEVSISVSHKRTTNL